MTPLRVQKMQSGVVLDGRREGKWHFWPKFRPFQASRCHPLERWPTGLSKPAFWRLVQEWSNFPKNPSPWMFVAPSPAWVNTNVFVEWYLGSAAIWVGPIPTPPVNLQTAPCLPCDFCLFLAMQFSWYFRSYTADWKSVKGIGCQETAGRGFVPIAEYNQGQGPGAA